MKKVLIYSKTYCGFCDRVKALFEKKLVQFEEIILDDAPEKMREISQKTGSRTVPQVFIGGEFVGGCDDVYALEREGKLDGLLMDE